MMAFRPKSELDMGTLYKNECQRKKGGDFPDVLAFPLYHGDLLVMHGTQIHEFYEVSPHLLVVRMVHVLT
jgi:hypothetical protein